MSVQKVDGLPVEKSCPDCGHIGQAQADEQGNHSGVWECKNEDCDNDYFVSSKMKFYRTDEQETETTGWTWDSIEQEVNDGWEEWM